MLTGILILAALIRLPGITWGLPYGLNTDEVLITRNALDLIVRNSFQPTEFARPDHLEFKLDSLAFRLYAFFAGTPAPRLWDQDAGQLLGVARTMTVLFSLGAVVLAFLVGRRFGRRVALIAAFLFAFYPPFIAVSSLAIPDMWLTTLLTAVLLTSLRYLERPSWLRLSVSCAMTALAVSVKYPGALGSVAVVAVIIVVAVRTGDRRRAIRHLLLAPAAFLAALFVISPVLVTNFSAVRRQLERQSGSGHLGASGLGFTGRVWFYLDYLGGWLTLVLVAAALLGIVQCIRSRLASAIPLSMGLVYLVAISTLGLHWHRWGVPIGISLLLFTAIGVNTVIETVLAARTAGRRHWKGLAAAAAVLLASAGVFQLSGSVATAGIFAADDTRVVARPWLAAHGITAQNSAFDSYTPLLMSNFRVAVSSLQERNGALVGSRPGVEYVVISSYIYDRIYTDPRFAGEARLVHAVERLPLVAEWTPTVTNGGQGPATLAPWDSVAQLGRFASGGMSGPTVRVYRLPQQASPAG